MGVFFSQVTMAITRIVNRRQGTPVTPPVRYTGEYAANEYSNEYDIVRQH